MRNNASENPGEWSTYKQNKEAEHYTDQLENKLRFEFMRDVGNTITDLRLKPTYRPHRPLSSIIELDNYINYLQGICHNPSQLVVPGDKSIIEQAIKKLTEIRNMNAGL